MVKLTDDAEQKNYQLGTIFTASVNAYVDEAYGQIRGTSYVRDSTSGSIVVDDTGVPLIGPQANLGSVLADWTGGINNSFRFKGVQLSFLIDMQKGGNIFSLTNTFGHYSGLFAPTAMQDGVDVRAEGLTLENVVTEDGQPYTETTDAQAYYENGYNITEQHVYDASFVKLREIRFGYNFGNNLFGDKVGLNDLTLSLVGRNLAILSKNIPNIDPEAATSATNVQGLEGGGMFPTRTIGLNLAFNF